MEITLDQTVDLFLIDSVNEILGMKYHEIKAYSMTIIDIYSSEMLKIVQNRRYGVKPIFFIFNKMVNSVFG